MRARRVLTLSAVFWASACGVTHLPDGRTEAEPDWNFMSAEQGLVTCAEFQDTGYVQGKPYPITLVTADGKPVEIDTANAYAVMQAAAAQAGVNIAIVSGFRTNQKQAELYDCYRYCNCNNCNLAAPPGYSNHQSGHALDLNTSSAGVYNWLANNAWRFKFERTVSKEPWHWEWWGGGPSGGPCRAKPVITVDGCTTVEADNCGKFGCGCVDHACNGGACAGDGCSGSHTQACGGFGCNCADGACSGGYCPGPGCSASEIADCGKFGCGCVDHKCTGGLGCAGTGCTPRETLDCGGFGCACVDHACSGGFCPGTGCTAKEAKDCTAQGCGCVDHKCSGGRCAGSGSTAKNVKDCGGFGCHSVDGKCSGGFCPGTGCTAKQTSDCDAKGCGCADEKCGGGACAGTGCTERQRLDCEKAGATCSLGLCRTPGSDAGFTVDAGRPPEPPEPDGGDIEWPDGGEENPTHGGAGDGGFVLPAIEPLSQVAGGCAQVPAPLFVGTLVLAWAARRRR